MSLNNSEFLRFFRLVTLPLSLSYMGVFAYLQAWVSLAAFTLFFSYCLYTLVRDPVAVGSLATRSLPVLFSLVHLMVVLLTGGIGSPHLVWMVTPIFAIGVLLGGRGSALATLGVLAFVSLLTLYNKEIAALSEFNSRYYRPVLLLSFASAIPMLGLLAGAYHRQVVQKAQEAAEQYQLALRALQEKEQLVETLEARKKRLDEVVTHFHQAQQVGNFGSFVHDHRTGRAHWSPELFQLLEVEPSEDLTIKEAFRTAHPDDISAMVDAITHYDRSKDNVELEFRVVLQRSKQIRYVRAVSHLEFDAESGALTRNVGVMFDITKLKEREQRHEMVVAQLRLATEQANIQIFEENLTQGTVKAIMGSTEMPEMTSAERMAATTPEYQELIINSMMNQGESVEFPLYLAGRSEPIWVRQVVLDCYWRDGDEMLLVFSFDITEDHNQLTQLEERSATISELNLEIQETQREVISTMGRIAESRSQETGNHVKRVAEYSYLLAIKYGLLVEDAELLRQASPMHDIGKVAIPDAILNKPGRHTPEEQVVMRTHARIGYEMMAHSDRDLLKAAAVVAHEHHEKWDGTGYPRGLAGEDIHIFGRITAIADVFDALGSDRAYKQAWEDERIFSLFREERGKHFDPDLIDIFFAHLDEFLAIREALQDRFEALPEIH